MEACSLGGEVPLIMAMLFWPPVERRHALPPAARSAKDSDHWTIDLLRLPSTLSLLITGQWPFPGTVSLPRLSFPAICFVWY